MKRVNRNIMNMYGQSICMYHLKKFNFKALPSFINLKLKLRNYEFFIFVSDASQYSLILSKSS